MKGDLFSHMLYYKFLNLTQFIMTFPHPPRPSQLKTSSSFHLSEIYYDILRIFFQKMEILEEEVPILSNIVADEETQTVVQWENRESPMNNKFSLRQVSPVKCFQLFSG